MFFYALTGIATTGLLPQARDPRRVGFHPAWRYSRSPRPRSCSTSCTGPFPGSELERRDLVSLYVMLRIGAVIMLYVRFWGHSDYFSMPKETDQPDTAD